MSDFSAFLAAFNFSLLDFLSSTTTFLRVIVGVSDFSSFDEESLALILVIFAILLLLI